MYLHVVVCSSVTALILKALSSSNTIGQCSFYPHIPHNTPPATHSHRITPPYPIPHAHPHPHPHPPTLSMHTIPHSTHYSQTYAIITDIYPHLLTHARTHTHTRTRTHTHTPHTRAHAHTHTHTHTHTTHTHHTPHTHTHTHTQCGSNWQNQRPFTTHSGKHHLRNASHYHKDTKGVAQYPVSPPQDGRLNCPSSL